MSKTSKLPPMMPSEPPPVENLRDFSEQMRGEGRGVAASQAAGGQEPTQVRPIKKSEPKTRLQSTPPQAKETNKPKDTRPKLAVAEKRPNRGPRKQLEQQAETKRRLTFHIASDVARRFMMKCAEEDRSMSAVAEQAMIEYLERA